MQGDSKQTADTAQELGRIARPGMLYLLGAAALSEGGEEVDELAGRNMMGRDRRMGEQLLQVLPQLSW